VSVILCEEEEEGETCIKLHVLRRPLEKLARSEAGSNLHMTQGGGSDFVTKCIYPYKTLITRCDVVGTWSSSYHLFSYYYASSANVRFVISENNNKYLFYI
jgi:hypothetical protein